MSLAYNVANVLRTPPRPESRRTASLPSDRYTVLSATASRPVASASASTSTVFGPTASGSAELIRLRHVNVQLLHRLQHHEGLVRAMLDRKPIAAARSTTASTAFTRRGDPPPSKLAGRGDLRSSSGLPLTSSVSGFFQPSPLPKEKVNPTVNAPTEAVLSAGIASISFVSDSSSAFPDAAEQAEQCEPASTIGDSTATQAVDNMTSEIRAQNNVIVALLRRLALYENVPQGALNESVRLMLATAANAADDEDIAVSQKRVAEASTPLSEGISTPLMTLPIAPAKDGDGQASLAAPLSETRVDDTAARLLVLSRQVTETKAEVATLYRQNAELAASLKDLQAASARDAARLDAALRALGLAARSEAGAGVSAPAVPDL